ncbi:MAG: polyprenyl diphosphate synthase [Patescibacteria group bacterium]
MPQKDHILPVHIGIIMDGNRRWARKRGLPTLSGHRKGYDRAIAIADHAFQRGVSYLTLFAFSTENWNRSKREVDYLMRLLLRMIDEQAVRLHKKGIRLLFIGSRKKLSSTVVEAIGRAHALTRENTRGTLLIALNYGGRQEIVEAARKAIKQVGKLSERSIAQNLYTASVPDPDFIIRTSGEERLSGFLLWQAAYAELYFTSILWPDFSEKDFDVALDEFSRRQRRFGH